MSEALILGDIDDNFFLSKRLAEEQFDFDFDYDDLSYTTEDGISEGMRLVEIRSGYWSSLSGPVWLTWTIDIHLAVELGVEELTISLLKRGVSVDSRNAWGQTPLHIAAEKDNDGLIPLLLDYNAQIEAKDTDFQTPLHLAAFWGNEAVISLLLKRRANVDATDKSGRTPLHLATQRGFKEVVTILLQFGADVNQTDNRGWTALHFAAHLGYDDLAIILCNKKANIDQTTNHGHTALYLAAEQGDVKMVYLLLELSANTEKADLNGWTPLYIASKNASLDVISALLEYNANAEAHNMNLRSPVNEAIEGGNIHQVSTLLQKRSSLVNKTGSGDNALHIAAEHNYLEVMKTVLALGANINAINREGHTVLYIAASLGHIDMVSYLLENGATMGGEADETIPELAKIAAETGHVNIVKMALGYQPDMIRNSKFRDTILHIAVAQGNLDMVSLLLEDGKVNLENLDDTGMTPLFAASDYPEMIALLLDRKANINARCKQRDNVTVLHHYVQLGKIKALNVLLNCGCNVEPTDDNGNTPLHYAVSNGNPAAVKLLVERGINMEIRNKYGRTAFHTAVECDNLQIVELLIDYDVNINAITDGIKVTPLQRAIQRHNLSMIQLLLDHNVKVNVKGDSGDTALHTAVRTGKDEIVSLLLRQGVKINAHNFFNDTALDLALRDSNLVISGLLIKAGAEPGSKSTSHTSSQRPAQSNDNDAMAGRQGFPAENEDLTWFKWVPGDGSHNFENVGYNDTQKLEAIENEYGHSLPSFMASNFPDIYDSDDEDQSFTAVRSDEALGSQTPPLSDDRSPSSSMMESDELGSELSNSIYDAAGETIAKYFNQTLDRATSKWASKVMEFLIDWCGVTLFYNESLFVLKLNNKPDGPSPSWVSQFNKMNIVREPEVLVVPRPKQNIQLSIPGWYDNEHLLIRFINAVYVCRMSSPKVSSQAFSEVLGCVEENISTPLRGTLIAGLAITSMRGGYDNADILVKAILSVYSEAVRTSELPASTDQQVLHRRKCNCGSSHEHRPLSPVAAAKAVGIPVWHARDEKRILPRVWDLHTDALVKNIDVRQVYFITHRWCEDEIEYKDIIMGRSANEARSASEAIGISTFSTKLKRIRSVIARHARYVWIDTICMDRSNLSEVDKTIRSMYKLYANCHAVVLDSDTSLNVWKSRGWCLQEGAAAGLLYGILEKDSKEELVSMQELAQAQNAHLCQLDLSVYYNPGNGAEILARMDARKTTHVEDMSYALIGIFSINIPLGYGEEWEARTKVLNELATKKGDISFLSFATTKSNDGKYLPFPKEKNYLVAQCVQANISASISHFGLTVEAQLVSIVEFQDMMDVLKRWKKLKMNRTKSVGLDQLISAAEQRDVRNSKCIEVAIVHSIRSIMLVEMHGDVRHMDGSLACKPCHRLQCCQFEQYEFERLFADINVRSQIIWLGDKPSMGTDIQNVQKPKEKKPSQFNLFRRGPKRRRELR